MELLDLWKDLCAQSIGKLIKFLETQNIWTSKNILARYLRFCLKICGIFKMIDFEAFPRAGRHFKGSKSKSMVSNYTGLTLIYLPQDWRCLISTSNSFNSAWMTAPKVKVLLLDVLEFQYCISRKFNFQSTITLPIDFYWKIGCGPAIIKCWNFKHS